MDRPPAVMCGDTHVRQVPAVDAFEGSALSSCEGCVFADNGVSPFRSICTYPNGPIGSQCIDNNTIYIEATDEAWAQYITSKIRHNLGETS